MLPERSLWPIDDVWCLHSSLRGRRDIDTNTQALAMQYGAATGAADYCAKSQHMMYDAGRALFEAWGRNRDTATGIIAWMFNSSWPSVNWQLFPYDLLPGGAYYGVKKACEPLHAQYSYDDGSVWVVHEGVAPRAGLRLTARIVDARGRQLDECMALVDVAAQDRVRVLALKPPRRISAVFFVHLTLADAAGERVSANTYALSRRAAPGLVPARRLEAAANPAAYNPFKKKYRMQVRPLADLRGLTRLTPARLRATATVRRQGDDKLLTVTIENRSAAPAFFLEVTAVDAQGAPLTPVFWDDNYQTLMPGERSVLHGRVRTGSPVRVTVSGWNVRQKTLSAS
jgi:exo-1,4-beta-D-glucosaminidase